MSFANWHAGKFFQQRCGRKARKYPRHFCIEYIFFFAEKKPASGRRGLHLKRPFLKPWDRLAPNNDANIPHFPPPSVTRFPRNHLRNVADICLAILSRTPSGPDSVQNKFHSEKAVLRRVAPLWWAVRWLVGIGVGGRRRQVVLRWNPKKDFFLLKQVHDGYTFDATHR